MLIYLNIFTHFLDFLLPPFPPYLMFGFRFVIHDEPLIFLRPHCISFSNPIPFWVIDFKSLIISPCASRKWHLLPYFCVSCRVGNIWCCGVRRTFEPWEILFPTFLFEYVKFLPWELIYVPWQNFNLWALLSSPGSWCTIPEFNFSFCGSSFQYCTFSFWLIIH